MNPYPSFLVVELIFPFMKHLVLRMWFAWTLSSVFVAEKLLLLNFCFYLLSIAAHTISGMLNNEHLEYTKCSFPRDWSPDTFQLPLEGRGWHLFFIYGFNELSHICLAFARGYSNWRGCGFVLILSSRLGHSSSNLSCAFSFIVRD